MLAAAQSNSPKVSTEADRFQDFLERALSRVNDVNERLSSLNQRALGPTQRVAVADAPTSEPERPGQFGRLSKLSSNLRASLDELEQLAGDIERIV